MKIALGLLSISLDALGGLNQRAGRHICALVQAGHQVTVLQSTGAAEGSVHFYRSSEGQQVRVVQIPFRFGNGRRQYLGYPRLWMIPLDPYLPADVELLDLWEPSAHLPQRAGLRTIFSHNHFAPYIWEHARNCGLRTAPMFLELPFLERILRKHGRGIDGYVTQTEDQKKWLSAKYNLPAGRICAIPPGYDAEILERLRTTNQPDTTGERSIVFSGRIQAWKGVMELFQAFQMLAADYPDWRLDYVGDGPLLDRIRTAAEGAGLHGRVRLHGRMTYDQALAVVARADIFAFPSYIETYGASLLEAMALGIPSVATGITAIRTHLIDNGQNGLTVPIRDATALKLALARLMGDARLRQQVGEAGRKKVAGLTYQAYLNATLAFYRQILA